MSDPKQPALQLQDLSDGTVHVLYRGVNRIGRSAKGNTLRLNHQDVSRWHLEIVIDDDGILVRDMGSSNGTSVNGIPVRCEHVLVGSEIWLSSQVRFLLLALAGEQRGFSGDLAQQAAKPEISSLEFPNEQVHSPSGGHDPRALTLPEVATVPLGPLLPASAKSLTLPEVGTQHLDISSPPELLVELALRCLRADSQQQVEAACWETLPRLSPFDSALLAYDAEGQLRISPFPEPNESDAANVNGLLQLSADLHEPFLIPSSARDYRLGKSGFGNDSRLLLPLRHGTVPPGALLLVSTSKALFSDETLGCFWRASEIIAAALLNAAWQKG